MRNTLETLLAELAEVDRELASVNAAAAIHGDGAEKLRGLLDQRAALIEKASGNMDTLRMATAEQQEQLLQSEQAGNELVRQLILAKHGLTQELMRVWQEQHLWGAMADSGLKRHQAPRRVDVNC
ncbi:MAG: hypothetical protein HY820_06265 [Acidobacteria bacterium]|nr:hypothetical protein [Acidobacteriota bacterium]